MTSTEKDFKHTLLCVDDEIDNADALERLFRKKFKVLKATSGPAALELLKQHDVAVIISDQRMPEMTGVEFLAKSLESHPNAIRLLLTGYTDIQSVIEAINSGQIYRYVTKPWDPVDLTTAVDRAVERYELQEKLKTQNIALATANENLKTLDQAKMHFMFLVNHELKTPLTAILSFGDLLSETKLDDDQELYLSRIQKSSQRLKKMVDDVLLVVSSDTEQVKSKIETLNAESLIYPLSAEIEATLEKRNLTLKLSGQKESFKSDPKLVRDVLQRLLQNSVKFATEGTEISCSFLRLQDSIRIQILNHGKEIPKEKLESLMAPFTINEDFMNHTQGTGLGLAVCHSVLKILHSQLEIQSLGNQFRAGFVLKNV